MPQLCAKPRRAVGPSSTPSRTLVRARRRPNQARSSVLQAGDFPGPGTVSALPPCTSANHSNRRVLTQCLRGLQKNYRQKLVIILWNDSLMKGFRYLS